MNRLTVVETVYHQSGDSTPTVATSGFGRMLATDELPYCRPRSVTDIKWSPVDCGWAANVSGVVLIQNLGGESTGKVPTKDEKSQEKARILEVRLGDSPEAMVWEVPPGESMRGQPADARELRVRCQSGSTRYSVTVFPR